MTHDRATQQSGFSLVEVAVALGIISTGIIGTLSMIGANRALMENNWDLARMNMIAESDEPNWRRVSRQRHADDHFGL